MANVLVNVTPFKSILKESKERPGVYEVEGVMQRAGAKKPKWKNIRKRSLNERG